MNIYKDINLQDCPICGGAGLIEDEGGHAFYVTCVDCGCQTASMDYRSPEEREAAAEKAAYIWNLGKVVSPNPGE